jgi:hypothetical protein
MKAHLFTCPVCGFIVFSEPSGSFDICPVCQWEDDHVQLAYPGLGGGANGASLWDYQKVFFANHSLDLKRYRGYQKDPEWRPLILDDLQNTESAPSTGLEYFYAAGADAPQYYWKKHYQNGNSNDSNV